MDKRLIKPFTIGDYQMNKNKITIIGLLALSILLAAILTFTLLDSPAATAQDGPPIFGDLTRTEVIKLIAVSDSVNLRGVNLQGVDLRRLDLSNVDFSFADLTNTDFTQANLLGANLTCATLGDYFFEGTILPNGENFSPTLDMNQFLLPPSGNCDISNVSGAADTVDYITLVQPSDPNAGIEILCGLSPLRQSTQFGQSGDATLDLITALQAVIDERNTANADLGLNPLVIDSVRVEGDHAIISISGDLGLAGACDDAVIDAQVSLTTFLNPDLQTAIVTVNGTNLRQMLFGEIGSALPDDAVYTREEVESQYSR